MPFVEGNYRTQPYRILVGHSLGGLLATHTMLSRPDLFDAHIAISPYLAWDNGVIFKDMKAALGRRAAAGGFYFATYGGLEGKDYDKNLRALRKTLKRNAGKKLAWQITKMPNDDHGTIVHPAIYTGLRNLYKNFRPKDGLDIAGLKKHYSRLSKQFGYEIRIPEQTVNMMGYGILMKKGDPKKAIAIFEENVKLYPHSANVYDSLGEAYEAAGQFDKALENYERAIKMLGKMPKHDAKVMQIYREHVARAKAAKKGKRHK
jgi:tetratricopeptide (TPR) repeat protein